MRSWRSGRSWSVIVHPIGCWPSSGGSTMRSARLHPQRKGVVDAYVVSIGLDSDPIFGREAREAGKVLSRRYDAAGRTIVLAGTDGSGPSTLPNGSPTTLAIALARSAS